MLYFVFSAAQSSTIYFRFPWRSFHLPACSSLSARQLLTSKASVCSPSGTSAGIRSSVSLLIIWEVFKENILWGLKHGKISLLRLLFSSGLLSELCFHYLNIYASLLRKVSKASQSFSKNQDVNIIDCAWNTWTSFEPILSQSFIFVLILSLFVCFLLLLF